jgi:hypothetical protein
LSRPTRVSRNASIWIWLWPFALYALATLLLFGVPIVEHPRGTILAEDEFDSSQFMWFFGWWPHAVLHGLNPFVTHLMFVPEGFNLQWTTSMPLPSVVLAPVTLALGPSITWNVLQLASPIVSAWAAYLLCRHVTRRQWPSIAGGYIYGFSPYMLTHLRGGPYLALVPLLPLIVLLVMRRVEGSVSRRRFTVLLTLALTAQYLIAIELLATLTLFGAVALGIAYLLFRERRAELRALVAPIAVAYLGTAVLVSPFLYYFFFSTQHPPGLTGFSSSLASFVLPHHTLEITKSHSPADPFRGAVLESYLGLPLIALIAAFAWQRRRSRSTWLLLGIMAVALVLSLGQVLYVTDRNTGVWMPWNLFADLPVLRYALPVRFILYAILPAAVIVALWLKRGGVPRWGLVALIAVSFLPNFANGAWRTDISDPPFFATDAYRHYLRPADHVLTIPASGPNQRWQADSRFDFELAGGYAGSPFPPSYSRYPAWDMFSTGRLTNDYGAELRRFVHAKGVTAVVVDERFLGPWRKLLASLRVRPIETGGVLFYRLREPEA